MSPSAVAQRAEQLPCSFPRRDGSVARHLDGLCRGDEGTRNLLDIVEDLERRGIALVVLSMGGQRIDTRSPTGKLMLTMLAANKIPVMSYHFAWPGYGHVAKAGDGFRYYPEPMNMLL